jgi:beta-lactamase class A
MDFRIAVTAVALTLSGFGADAKLDEQIRAKLKNFPATVTIYAKNLESGASYTLNGDDPVRTASTIKLAVMTEVFAAVEEGRAKWNETIVLRESDIVSGSGILREFSDGLWVPIRDLVHLMIVVSDNTATNLLIDRFTADAVNARMEKLGFAQTRLMRKVRGDGTKLKPAEGWSVDGRKAENQRFGLGRTSPHEMVTLLEKMDRGELVSAVASKEMIEILKRQQLTEGIGRKTGRLTVASKSGSLDALRSDVGIVYAPGGKIAMAITVDGMKEIDDSVDNIGNVMIADLAQVVIRGLGSRTGGVRAKAGRFATVRGGDFDLGRAHEFRRE